MFFFSSPVTAQAISDTSSIESYSLLNKGSGLVDTTSNSRERLTDLWTAAERVKHVKEHKTCERHGSVAWRDNVVSHLQGKVDITESVTSWRKNRKQLTVGTSALLSRI